MSSRRRRLRRTSPDVDDGPGTSANGVSYLSELRSITTSPDLCRACLLAGAQSEWSLLPNGWQCRQSSYVSWLPGAVLVHRLLIHNLHSTSPQCVGCCATLSIVSVWSEYPVDTSTKPDTSAYVVRTPAVPVSCMTM